MRQLLCVLMSAVFFLSVDALADTSTAVVKAKTAKKCLFPKSRKRAPSWVCDARADGLAVTAVGSAPKSAAGIEVMEQKAAADARTKLAWILHGSKANEKVDSNFADESLQGTRIIKRAYAPNGTLYVLLGIDEAGAQKLRDSMAAEHK
jgi:hypothetical protein